MFTSLATRQEIMNNSIAGIMVTSGMIGVMCTLGGCIHKEELPCSEPGEQLLTR